MGKSPRKMIGARAKRSRNRDEVVAEHRIAIGENVSALQAHTKSLQTAAVITNKLNRIGVRKILAEIWGVPSYKDVDEKEPLSDYITGGPQAIMDFGDTLNEHFPGLHLSPGDLKNVKTVGTLINVILKHLG
jgi:hypothetical protein